MNTICDGLGCKNNGLPWKYDGTALHHTDGSVALPLNGVLIGLEVVLKAGGYTGKPRQDLPTMKNLCDACWMKQARAWDKNETTYGPSMARCTPDGIYWNNTNKEWNKNAKPYVDRIRSTVVHEFMHWIAIGNEAANNGLQNKIAVKNVNWDECVTDMLGHLTYKQLKYGTYVTGYGNWLEWIKLSTAYVNNLPGFKLKDFMAKLKNEKDETYPLPVREVVQKNPEAASHTSLIEATLKEALFKWFVTWDLQGPKVSIADVGGDFDHCVKVLGGIIFDKLGSVLKGGEIKEY